MPIVDWIEVQNVEFRHSGHDLENQGGSYDTSTVFLEAFIATEYEDEFDLSTYIDENAGTRLSITVTAPNEVAIINDSIFWRYDYVEGNAVEYNAAQQSCATARTADIEAALTDNNVFYNNCTQMASAICANLSGQLLQNCMANNVATCNGELADANTNFQICVDESPELIQAGHLFREGFKYRYRDIDSVNLQDWFGGDDGIVEFEYKAVAGSQTDNTDVESNVATVTINYVRNPYFEWNELQDGLPWPRELTINWDEFEDVYVSHNNPDGQVEIKFHYPPLEPSIAGDSVCSADYCIEVDDPNYDFEVEGVEMSVLQVAYYETDDTAGLWFEPSESFIEAFEENMTIAQTPHSLTIGINEVDEKRAFYGMVRMILTLSTSSHPADGSNQCIGELDYGCGDYQTYDSEDGYPDGCSQDGLNTGYCEDDNNANCIDRQCTSYSVNECPEDLGCVADIQSNMEDRIYERIFDLYINVDSDGNLIPDTDDDYYNAFLPTGDIEVNTGSSNTSINAYSNEYAFNPGWESVGGIRLAGYDVMLTYDDNGIPTTYANAVGINPSNPYNITFELEEGSREYTVTTTVYDAFGNQTTSINTIDVDFLFLIRQSIPQHDPINLTFSDKFMLYGPLQGYLSLDGIDLDVKEPLGLTYSYPNEIYPWSEKILTLEQQQFETEFSSHINENNPQFTPDVDVRTRISFDNAVDAPLFQYYDSLNDRELYESTTAPTEVQFNFYPRSLGEPYNAREQLIDIEKYYVAYIDWGDGSPIEFFDEPHNLGSTIYHHYESWGLYTITGYMLYHPDIIEAYTEYQCTGEPTLNVCENNYQAVYGTNLGGCLAGFSGSPDYCYQTGQGGICFTNYDYCEVRTETNCEEADSNNFASPCSWDLITIPETDSEIHYRSFTLKIFINKGIGVEDEFEAIGGAGYRFIPYDNTTPVIGGISDNSLYVKSLRVLGGFISDTEQIPTPFLKQPEQLKLQRALYNATGALGNELEKYEQLEFDTDDSEDLFGLSVYETYYSGLQQHYEELGKHLGDVDIGQVRVFTNGAISLYEMLGFDHEVAGTPHTDRYWKNIIPDYYGVDDREGLILDDKIFLGLDDEYPNQNWIDDYYYPVLPKIIETGKFNDYDDLQNDHIPFGTSGRGWNEDDQEALITSPQGYHPDLVFDMDISEIADNTVVDNIGNNIGIFINDYRLDITTEKTITRVDYPLSIELGSRDDRKAY